jgi:acyl-CoA synthetase (NDP forming)
MERPRIALVTPNDAFARLFGDELERRGLTVGHVTAVAGVDAGASAIGLVLDAVHDGHELMQAVRAAKAPVVALKAGSAGRQVCEAALRQAGAVVTDETGEFVPVLAAVAHGRLAKAGPTRPGEASLDARPDQQKGTGAAVQPMTIEGTGEMDEYETKRLLDRWGVPVVPETLVTGPGRHEFTPIRKLATHLGFPVALKAIRRDIVRKSEMGAVVVGIPSIDHLKQAWEDMHARFPDAAWLIQPFLPGDVELLIRAWRDAAFGPVVTFGPGGIMTELYQDVSTRVAPFGLSEATLLKGFRGLPAHELQPIADVIVRLGDLMLGQPSVQRLELDPLLVTDKGPVVVDAKAAIG